MPALRPDAGIRATAAADRHCHRAAGAGAAVLLEGVPRPAQDAAQNSVRRSDRGCRPLQVGSSSTHTVRRSTRAMTVARPGHAPRAWRVATADRALPWLPSITQAGAAAAWRTPASKSARGRGVQSGPQYSASSSTCGTPSAAANWPARRDLPAPLVPTTRMRGLLPELLLGLFAVL